MRMKDIALLARLHVDAIDRSFAVVVKCGHLLIEVFRFFLEAGYVLMLDGRGLTRGR